MDLANPRILTLEDFKEYFRLIINTHTSSTYTITDIKDNYLIAVEGVGVYRVIFNKPSTFEFKDLRGNWITKHLPFEVTVESRNGGVREKIIQRLLYDFNTFGKEVIVKVL